jgi:hypothetical protein
MKIEAGVISERRMEELQNNPLVNDFLVGD